MKATDVVRVRLDDAAVGALSQMTTTLAAEGQHLSLVPSRVVSIILCDYAARYFGRDKSRLMEALLDRRACLKAMLAEIKDGSDEEIERLKVQLAGLGPKRGTPSQLHKKMPMLPPSGENPEEGT